MSASLPAARGEGVTAVGVARPLVAHEWASALPPAQDYVSGTTLFKQNTQASEAFLINEGFVRRMRETNAGRHALELSFPGVFVGAASALLGAPHTATAMAGTDCRLQRVPAEALAALLWQNRELGAKMHQLLAAAVVGQDDQIALLGRASSRLRLERVLGQLVNASPSSRIVSFARDGATWLQLPMSHADLADLIAVTPPHLSRLFKQLQEDGVIRLSKGWVILPHAPGLRGADSPADAARQ